MLDRLPECLVIEILCRLPTKSLLRFKSTSKSWNAIIKSHHFVSKHLKYNNHRSANFMIAQYVTEPRGRLECFRSCLDNSVDVSVIDDRDIHSLLHCELLSDNYDMCGSCNGIYYMWNRRCDSINYGERWLWNLALNEKKTLPPIMKPNIPSRFNYSYTEHCCFGFDPVNEDYKLVSIKGYVDKSPYTGYDLERYLDCPDLSIMIYSLRNDSWKYVGDLSNKYFFRENNACHTFVNTSCYWLGSYEGDSGDEFDVVIALDLVTEATQEILCLPEMRKSRGLILPKLGRLTAFNSSIAMVTFYDDNASFDIWTLKERSWSKEFTAKLDHMVARPLGHYRVNSNRVAFDDLNGSIVVWEPDKEETVVKILAAKPTNYGWCKTVSSYAESLVPLNDRNFWEQREQH